MDLLNQIVNFDKSEFCFLKEQLEEDIFIEIPFIFKKDDKQRFYGIDPILNQEVIIQKNNVIGYSWFDSSQKQDLENKIKNIKFKYQFMENLKYKYHSTYIYHEKYIIYSHDNHAQLMAIFNIKNPKELYEIKSDINFFIKIYKIFLLEKVSFNIKEELDKLSEEYKNDENILEYIKDIKLKIDQKIIDHNYDKDNIYDLVKCWPNILGKNIFSIDSYEE